MRSHVILWVAVVVLTVLQLTGPTRAQPQEQVSRPAFEYKLVVIEFNTEEYRNDTKAAAKIEEELNHLRREGWVIDRNQESMFVFKREKKNESVRLNFRFQNM